MWKCSHVSVADAMPRDRQVILTPLTEWNTSMQAIVNLVVFIAWLAEARFIFRYMVRNDTFKSYDNVCAHNLVNRHKGLKCHKYRPWRHGPVAVIAAFLAFFGPVILIPAVIMYRPPVCKLEAREHVARLEAENTRLRLNQEKENGSLLP